MARLVWKVIHATELSDAFRVKYAWPACAGTAGCLPVATQVGRSLVMPVESRGLSGVGDTCRGGTGCYIDSPTAVALCLDQRLADRRWRAYEREATDLG